MEEGPKNRQHPKRSTFSENRWERLYKTITHAFLAISNVRTEACACARTRVIFIGYHRVAIPWLPNVTYRSVDIDSARGDNDRSVPFRIPLSGNCGLGGSRQDGYYLLPSRCSCTPKTYGTPSLFAGCIYTCH